MRIDQINLEHYRGFARLELGLHPEFTLLVGDNGSGKSSILEAISVALDALFLGFPELTSTGIPRDARRQARVTRLFGESFEATGTCVVTAVGELGGEALEWTRSMAPSRSARTVNKGSATLKEAAAKLAAKVPTGEPVDLPVFGYYGTGRLWLEKSDRTKRKNAMRREDASILQGYRTCLDAASDAKMLEAWMAWREMSLVQRLAKGHLTDGGIAPMSRDPLLDAVSKAAGACVGPDCLLRYDIDSKQLVLLRGAEPFLPFRLLSDGYRNMVGMAADIAWRATRLNPHLGDAAPRQARGVVLIDEIDLHLHPSWQRRVVGDLRRVFPGLQFVATTHSPQVVASVEPGCLRVLGPVEANSNATKRSLRHTRGRDSNALLEDVFETPARPE